MAEAGGCARSEKKQPEAGEACLLSPVPGFHRRRRVMSRAEPTYVAG